MQLDKKIERLLSTYLDGEATDRERKFVEKKLEREPEWQEELLRLRRLQGIVAAKEKIPPSEYFLIRLRARIEDERNKETVSFLPFSKKWIPAFSITSGLAVIILLITFFIKHDSIQTYVKQTTADVRDWYEQSIINGRVSSMLGSLTDDDVFQFALTGLLPVNKEKGQVLQFGDQPAQGHFVQAGFSSSNSAPSITKESIVKKLGLDPTQSIALDSTLHNYRDRLAQCMVVSQIPDTQFMAINADVWAINKVLMVDIARTLTIPQRRHFAALLVAAKSPVILDPEAIGLPMNDSIIIQFREKGPSSQFVVITPDTLFVREMPHVAQNFVGGPSPKILAIQNFDAAGIQKRTAEITVSIFNNLKRHQLMAASMNRQLYRLRNEFKKNNNDLSIDDPYADAHTKHFAKSVSRTQNEIVNRYANSLPDSLDLYIEIKRDFGAMPEMMQTKIDRMLPPISIPVAVQTGTVNIHQRSSRSTVPMVWEFHSPDSIRLMMAPGPTGIILVGDQEISFDSAMQQEFKRFENIRHPMSQEDLEKRLKQMEQQLRKMQKRLQKLEDPE